MGVIAVSFSDAGTDNQYRKIDSLLFLLKETKEDTSRAELLSTVSQGYFPLNPDTGMQYGRQALQLSQKLTWTKGIALAYNAIGANYWAKADYVKAQDNFLKARDFALDINEAGLLSPIYHSLAISYFPFGNTDKGVEYLQKALVIGQQLGNYSRVMGINHNLAEVYEGKGDHRTALSYYLKALPAAFTAHHQLGIAHTYLKIGTLYTALNEINKGLQYLQKSLAAAKAINEQPAVALALISIGEAHRKQSNYTKAKTFYDSALLVSATFKGKFFKGEHGGYLFRAGELYRAKAQWDKKQGRPEQASSDYRQAVAYLKQGLQVSGSVQDWVAMRDQALLLSDVYQEWGNGKKALQAFKQYITYRDSVMNIEKAKQRAQHEMRVVYDDSLSYLKKLQEKQLYILAQENRLNKYKVNQVWLFFAITVIALTLVGSIFLHRYRLQRVQIRNDLQQEKLQKQFREAELQHRLNDMTLTAFRSQMNPHFIFNALNTIQSYVFANDKRMAGIYLGKFSELMRKILDHSNKQAITLEEEMEMVQLYIDIEIARFGNSLNAEIQIDAGLNTEDILIPPLLVQPHVENAIKHGLLHMAGEKILLVTVIKSNDQKDVEIRIDDNGIGRKKSWEYNKDRTNHNSFANAANEKRIHLMNELSHNKIRLNVIDKKNADGSSGGTLVVLCIQMVSSAVPSNILK